VKLIHVKSKIHTTRNVLHREESEDLVCNA